MKIAILGTGGVGGTLGTRWAAAGYEVVFGSRQPESEKCLALLEEWLIPGQGVTTLCAIAASNQEGISFLELQGFQRTGEPAPSPIGSGDAFWMCW